MNDSHEWQCDFYSHQDSITKHHVTVGYGEIKDDNILPFKGNEHLVGTTDEPDEEVRLEEGEWIIPADIIDVYENVVNCIIRQFNCIEADLIKCMNSTAWALAIRFSDFNPEDMEETKKQILCVRDGKIVRHKG